MLYSFKQFIDASRSLISKKALKRSFKNEDKNESIERSENIFSKRPVQNLSCTG